MNFYEATRKIYNVKYVCYTFIEWRTCALALECHNFIFSLFSTIIHNYVKVKASARDIQFEFYNLFL